MSHSQLKRQFLSMQFDKNKRNLRDLSLTRNVKRISYPDRGCAGQSVRLEEATANHVEPDPSRLRPPAVTRSALRRASLRAGRASWGLRTLHWRRADFLHAHMPQELPVLFVVWSIAALTFIQKKLNSWKRHEFWDDVPSPNGDTFDLGPQRCARDMT